MSAVKTETGKAPKDGSPDESKNSKKGFFAKRFSKKKGKKNGEMEEYVEEDISVSSDEIIETAHKKGLFKGFNFMKGNSTSVMGKTVVMAEDDSDDDDFFCPKKSEKIQNAESFVAEKIQQMQKNSLIKKEKVKTIDIETTESEAENNDSINICNSRGVMTFDGMAEDEDLENELNMANSSDNNKGKKELSFIKAPVGYDPVVSGFYKPAKKTEVEHTIEEKESIEVVKENGVCCAVWN